jgi:putative phosphoribosyl transferase
MARNEEHVVSQAVAIYSDCAVLNGDLTIPRGARGVVLFAHGSGSSRLSPRNRFIAEKLHQAGFGTLLFDLLTEAEAANQRNILDVHFLAHRLLGATEWFRRRMGNGRLALGYFGADTGSAAAILAAAIDHGIHAVVSRSGRPDLAFHSLPRVKAPTLLVVGGEDTAVIKLNRKACGLLSCEKKLEVVPGAGHYFGEPGALDEMVRLARGWFESYMAAPRPARAADVLGLSVSSLGGRLRDGLLSGRAPVSTRLGGSITHPAN